MEELTLKQLPHSVEAEQVIKHIIAGHVAHQVYHGVSQNDVQHQIGNTFVSVPIAEQIKLSAKFFHGCHSYGMYL